MDKVDRSSVDDHGGNASDWDANTQCTTGDSQPRPEDMKAAAELVFLADKDRGLEPIAEEPALLMASENHEIGERAFENAPGMDKAVAVTFDGVPETNTGTELIAKDKEAAISEGNSQTGVNVARRNDAAPSLQPRPPIREVLPPGAYRVPGPDADRVDDSFTISPPSVADSPTVATNATVEISTAELFDADAENRDIDQLVQQRLQEIREDEAVAQVVPNNAPLVPEGDQPPSNGPKGWSFSSLNRSEITLGVITVVLVIAAIVLWIVFATIKDDPVAPAFPTQSPMQFRTLKEVSPQPASSFNQNFQPLAVRELQPIAFPTTKAPTTAPTRTAEPTFREEISVTTFFNQRFQIGYELEFNETEQVLFCQNMEGYTDDLGYTDDFGGRDDGRVNTTCRFISQSLQFIGGSRRTLREKVGNNSSRGLQGVVFNQVDYAMSYRSKYENITPYSTFFQNYVNEDLDRLTVDLQNAGLAVTNSFLAFNKIGTFAPTISPRPTVMPSVPLPAPTSLPLAPFIRPPNSPEETHVPTSEPSVSPPNETISNKKASIKISAIVVTVLAGLSATALTLIMIYSRSKQE